MSRRKKGRKLWQPKVRKEFLDLTRKVQPIKKNPKKLGFIQIKNFCSV